MPVGSDSAAAPFSCARSLQLSAGAVLDATTLDTSDVSQRPQLCAARCRANATCDAFYLAGALCVQQLRPASQLVQSTANYSITVSCLRYGLDFVNAGRALAQQVR